MAPCYPPVGPATHLVWLVVVAPLWFFVFNDGYPASDEVKAAADEAIQGIIDGSIVAME